MHARLVPRPRLLSLSLLLALLLARAHACVHYKAYWGCSAADLAFHVTIEDNGVITCWTDANYSVGGPDAWNEFPLACNPGYAAWVSQDQQQVHYHAHGVDFAWQAPVLYDANPYGCNRGPWWDEWLFGC